MKRLALVLSLAAAVGVGGSAPRYELTEVKSKVVVTHDGAERRAEAGETAWGGDLVRTGWWGRTVIRSEEAASSFELFARTTAQLGGEEPGVLLVLQRGRLEAVFDALAGRQDRMVATPGALLAVRGTRYGVEVDTGGEATLVVFEGTVEVLPRQAGAAPLAVGAGELCRFGPSRAPQRETMPRGMSEESWRRNGAPATANDGTNPGGPDRPGTSSRPEQRPGAGGRGSGAGRPGGGGE